MSHPIDKKAVYTARYPKGTIIELVEPLEDPYAPKPVGSRFKVDCVDDALQLQAARPYADHPGQSPGEVQ